MLSCDRKAKFSEHLGNLRFPIGPFYVSRISSVNFTTTMSARIYPRPVPLRRHFLRGYPGVLIVQPQVSVFSSRLGFNVSLNLARNLVAVESFRNAPPASHTTMKRVMRWCALQISQILSLLLSCCIFFKVTSRLKS